VSQKEKAKDRRDHYLPRAYLKGFIDPAREHLSQPLFLFDLKRRRWKHRSPKQIGYIDGFYDFAAENNGAEHPDVTFQRLENDFPAVRSKIISDGFASWIDHKEFLLQYMQMIRARSPLFFEQWREQAKTIQMTRITEVLHDVNAVRVDSSEWRRMTKGETQDWTIAKMREEIKKGTDWLANFHWALRYTDSPVGPVITADHPFVSIGTSTDTATAINDPETLVYFPICWQAFLFGSIRKFDIETEKFHPDTLRRVRRAYFENGRDFLVSPSEIEMT
jgi:hypothetical protein